MAGKAILLCGKICCGKSTYAEKLRQEQNAAVLSCDELMLALFPAQLGDRHEEIAARCRSYLMDRASELIALGVPVVLDWGFWSRDSRRAAEAFFRGREQPTEWHYLEVSEETWRKNIAKRNQESPPGAYAVDTNLAQKCAAQFEEPSRKEMDVWVVNEW